MKTNKGSCFNCGNSANNDLPICRVGVYQTADFERCAEWIEGDGVDICLVCGEEINLALLHGYDRVLGEPVHSRCSKENKPAKSLLPKHSKDLPF